jgi:hypothetical protein
VSCRAQDYLETKRSAFPRFYFLSNDELLQILSQTRDPAAVQPHMSKCFDSIARIEFGDDEDAAKDIFAMFSSEGERVPFSAPVSAIGNVESWLGDVERMMRTTLFNLTKEALEWCVGVLSRCLTVLARRARSVVPVALLVVLRLCLATHSCAVGAVQLSPRRRRSH